MPLFQYKAIDATGGETSGTLEAADVVQAAMQLAEQGMTVQALQQIDDVAATGAGIGPDTASPLGATQPDAVAVNAEDEAPPHDSEALLSHLWLDVIAKREHLLPALKAYAEDATDRKDAAAVKELVQAIQHADPTSSEIVNQHKLGADYEQFARYYCALFAANAASDSAASSPSVFLQRFTQRLMPTEAVPQRLGRALIYPLGVLLLTVVVLFGIASIVVPTFESIYNDFGLDLPVATKFLITISHLARFDVLVQLVVWLLALYVLWKIIVWSAFETHLLRLRGWLGWRVGWIATLGPFASRVANLMEAGLTRQQAVELAGYGAQRQMLQEGARRLASLMPDEASSESTHGEVSFTPSPHVPWRLASQMGHTLTHTLQADIKREARIDLLHELAEVYADRTRKSLSLTYGAIGVAALVLTGGAVGFATVALFAPLVRLIEGLT